MFVGYFHRGLPTGYCWLAKEGQGWLFGEVDERGRFSGDNIAYIYPDLLTAITGTFEKEVIMDIFILDSYVVIFFLTSDQPEACYLGPNYTPGVDLLEHDFL